MDNSNLEIKSARQLFASEGLTFPSIPIDVQSDFREIAAWVYGTRSDVPSLCETDWFINEVIQYSVPNYVMIGHAGHGINSYAIYFYLVLNYLALFIQIGWGGVYMDKAETTQAVAEAFSQADHLTKIMEERERAVQVAPDSRLIVVVSDFRQSWWTWVPRHPVAGIPATWQESEDIWSDVFAALHADSADEIASNPRN